MRFPSHDFTATAIFTVLSKSWPFVVRDSFVSLFLYDRWASIALGPSILVWPVCVLGEKRRRMGVDRGAR